MEWKHKCSLEWLQKRQGFLTASEIKRLIPVTATGRKRKITDDDRRKVLASKLTSLTEEDCWSYGAAARGHMLEPYAVAELNAEFERSGTEYMPFFWWDDILIDDGLLAFSPDAMNISPESKRIEPTVIAEIKSYSAEKHLMCCYTPLENLEERWQVATAMAVCPSICDAYLVFFNPKMTAPYKMCTVHAWRSELQDELDMIYEVRDDWYDFLHRGWGLTPKSNHLAHCNKSEKEIVSEITARQRLNP